MFLETLLCNCLSESVGQYVSLQFFNSEKGCHQITLSPEGVSPAAAGGAACAPEFANVLILLSAFCITENANKPTAQLTPTTCIVL